MSIQRYLIHFDSVSFGLYPFPLQDIIAELSSDRPVDLPHFEIGCTRAARSDEDSIRVYGGTIRPRVDVRLSSAGRTRIHTWIRLPASAAPIVLIDSLPHFWTNRFRITRETRSLESDVVKRLDWASLTKARIRLREALVHHRFSLQQKLAAMHYHRGNLNEAVDQLTHRPPSLPFDLVRATAEYNALLGCMYSILEELAAVFRIFKKIREGNAPSASFHQLHTKRAEASPELRSILDAAHWYEPFRLRRANSTHAFNNIIALSDEDTDLYLLQHPDPEVYVHQTIPPDFVPNAKQLVDKLLHDYEQFLCAFSRHLLQMFHPWDIVTISSPAEDGAGFDEADVWVRGVLFRSRISGEPTSWAGFDNTGRMAFRIDSRGGLVGVSAHKDTGAS